MLVDTDAEVETEAEAEAVDGRGGRSYDGGNACGLSSYDCTTCPLCAYGSGAARVDCITRVEEATLCVGGRGSGVGAAIDKPCDEVEEEEEVGCDSLLSSDFVAFLFERGGDLICVEFALL